MPESEIWRCPRCGSSRWVATSLTGPRMYGGRGIPQCVPCGYYDGSTDVEPLEDEARAARRTASTQPGA